MKINEMFFWSLLLAYENVCRDLSVKLTNRDPEYLFHSNLVDAIFTIDSKLFKAAFLDELVAEYPFLEKAVSLKQSEFLKREKLNEK
ncbi:MAG: hypothetical protein ACRC11_08125 [Xenococcaceae cyanobacterium]